MTNTKTPGTTRAIVANSGMKPVAATAAASNRSTGRTQSKPAPKPVAEPEPAPVARQPKQKLVRDSFTIPKSEYSVLESLKLRAAKLGHPAKKSELLRAGVSALNSMSDKAFLAALDGIPSLKTGRPKNSVPEEQ